MPDNIFNTENCSYIENLQPDLFNVRSRDTNRRCEVPTLQIAPHHYLEKWLDVVKQRDLDWHSKPHCYCLLTRPHCEST